MSTEQGSTARRHGGYGVYTAGRSHIRNNCGEYGFMSGRDRLLEELADGCPVCGEPPVDALLFGPNDARLLPC